jgi:hypothetical protein
MRQDDVSKSTEDASKPSKKFVLDTDLILAAVEELEEEGVNISGFYIKSLNEITTELLKGIPESPALLRKLKELNEDYLRANNKEICKCAKLSALSECMSPLDLDDHPKLPTPCLREDESDSLPNSTRDSTNIKLRG